MSRSHEGTYENIRFSMKENPSKPQWAANRSRRSGSGADDGTGSRLHPFAGPGKRRQFQEQSESEA